jgi:methionyl-tRNA synthetase
MLGRKIVVVANLKPATMMGLESRGMLLAASSADRTSLSLINPGEDATVGSLVS